MIRTGCRQISLVLPETTIKILHTMTTPRKKGEFINTLILEKASKNQDATQGSQRVAEEPYSTKTDSMKTSDTDMPEPACLPGVDD